MPIIDRHLNYGRHLIERFLRNAGPYKKVLDIGAGHGDDLMISRKVSPTAELFGIECFPPYIKQLEDQGVKVSAINIERDPFPFADESLDVVMANQILEHTKEVFWIMDQVSRTLKVGGRFIIGVPNLAALHNRILLAIGRQPSPIKNNSAHVRGFTIRDMVSLVDSGFMGGYQLLSRGGSNFYPFPPFLARPFAALLPSMAWGLFLSFKKKRGYNGEYLKFPIEQQLETNFFLGDKTS